MKIVLPKLTDYQQKVVNDLDDQYNSGKVVVVKSLRQVGKSFTASVILLMYALKKKCTSIYVAPTLLQTNSIYKNIVDNLITTGLITNANNQQHEITFVNGSRLILRSTAQKQNLRGLTATGILILDEAAYLTDDDINICLPFCNAANAPMLVISTPLFRQGYFYDVYTKGLNGCNGIKSYDWATEPETSRFLTSDKKEFYKQTMSRQMFSTEILGEFLTNDGSVFTNITNNLISNSPNFTEVYIGIDFGTGGNDYTAVSVMNENKEQVSIYKTNNKTPMEQVEWIAGIINMFPKVGKILAEQNSIGKVYIDALKTKIKFPITNWTTTNSSKKELVNNLQIALENNTVKLQNDEELVTELAAYEMNITKNGVITFGGKVGTHDDLVMATMLSLRCLTSSNGKYNIKFI